MKADHETQPPERFGAETGSAFPWRQSGPEWQACPDPNTDPGLTYGCINFTGLWYPYMFQGTRYKRGQQLSPEGMEESAAKKTCEDHYRRTHWRNAELRRAGSTPPKP